MSEEELLIGDDAVHGEEAYALWGDGEKLSIFSEDTTHHGHGVVVASSGATQVV
ncbi:ammonium transporter 3 member 1-like [Senna tora]|uniref:Ammonium transporter 3 member 1-like n=1 Tax=Senna tora TaxID=362788 RepID=A0A834X9V9_9FABA|nr:ammonium transporter 3 member 1-like [Senna tora]